MSMRLRFSAMSPAEPSDESGLAATQSAAAQPAATQSAAAGADGELVQHDVPVDGVHVLTLSNGKLNPLSVEVLNALADAVDAAEAVGSRAIVITGNDRAFAAGADITQFTSSVEPFEIAPADRVREIGGAFLRALNAVAHAPCPTIAAVSGVALGGGCELALACDFRVATTGSKFGQPEILLGIIPGGGGTQRLTRLVGTSRAKDLIFTGRMIGAPEAQQIGLVDRIADDGASALDVALLWAGELAVGPRDALRLAKQAIDGGLEQTLDAGLRLEQDLFVDSFATSDARIGVESFLTQGPGRARFDHG